MRNGPESWENTVPPIDPEKLDTFQIDFITGQQPAAELEADLLEADAGLYTLMGVLPLNETITPQEALRLGASIARHLIAEQLRGAKRDTAEANIVIVDSLIGKMRGEHESYAVVTGDNLLRIREIALALLPLTEKETIMLARTIDGSSGDFAEMQLREQRGLLIDVYNDWLGRHSSMAPRMLRAAIGARQLELWHVRKSTDRYGAGYSDKRGEDYAYAGMFLERLLNGLPEPAIT